MSDQIMIVEDDHMLRSILEIVLSEAGYEIDVCEDGQVAIDRLTELRDKHDPEELPMMVILDLSMPVVDGWQVAAWIDADPALRDIPVIVTSATEEYGEKAKKLHADAYLVKPYSTDEILGAIALFSTVGHRPSTRVKPVINNTVNTDDKSVSADSDQKPTAI